MKTRALFGISVGVLAFAGAALASPTKTIPDGPATGGARPAAAILADVVAAMGGEAAWNAHTSMSEKIELSIAGLGMNGTGQRISTKDDKALLTTTLPGIGTTREGSNGKVVWSEDPINGARVLAGAEAEAARLESMWAPELRFDKLFTKIESTTETGAGGVALECLVLTPHEGTPLTNCYDAKTHLQVVQRGSHPTPQGDTPFTSTVKDWRDVQGLKMPFAVETQTGPITFTLKITELELDVPVEDAKVFEPPAGALAGKAKGAKAKKPAKAKAAPKAKAK
ncbi:MAG TPA: hypothetical protein VHJ20_07290 [Polyangia bacterium]|nr:hypothetical protein [Polyangia bacterium]